jgi:glycosidase
VSIDVRSVGELDLARAGAEPKTPSPSAWEDEVLYFLLIDRFSDGRESMPSSSQPPAADADTPLYTPADNGGAVQTPDDADRWREAGRSWVGGTLAGIRSKLDYLAGVGITALWISPVLKQSLTPVAAGVATNYHGYATQDFLQVDPHFGTADDLRNLVKDAHNAGLRVILDVVLNHTGDVFAYQADAPWDGTEHAVAGWRDDGQLLPFTKEAAASAWPDGAVFPAELHEPSTFTRRGYIINWDHAPEYVEGDFQRLKDITHGSGPTDQYVPSPALRALTTAYCWWIAFADLDGFRIDTVKHMDPGATRYFASAVHEFAQSIGKDRFFLVGEITGSREQAVDTMELTGLDAALGLADVQAQLEATAKGLGDPRGYFDLFRNSALIGKESHTWLRNTVVTSYDDHDQVRKGPVKARFCADDDGPALALAVLALNATTLGIPCVYYGSEQGLDGTGGGVDADRYIREAMFGGKFGAFRSRGRHVFDVANPLRRELAAVLAVRHQEPALRRGRQYLRQISGDGVTFGFPSALGGARVRSIIAWSRLLAGREVLCAINNDPHAAQGAWVTVDAELHDVSDTLSCLYRSDNGPRTPLTVVAGDRVAVRLDLPPGGVAIYAR